MKEMTNINPNFLKHTRIVARIYVMDYLQPHAEGGQVIALMGLLKDNGRVVRQAICFDFHPRHVHFDWA